MKLYPNQLQMLRTLLTVWSDNPEKLVGEILDEVEAVQNTTIKLEEEIKDLKETVKYLQDEARRADEYIDLIENRMSYFACRIDDFLPEQLMPNNDRRSISEGDYPGLEMSFQQVGVINYLMGKKMIPQKNFDTLVEILQDWDPWKFEKSPRANHAWAEVAIAKLESLPDK
jgi:predicted nuclease with TOPRIM domain